MKHFKFFPRVEYSDNIITNITLRAKVRDLVLSNQVVYYEYVLDDHERPDILAHKYYGSTDHTWILFYANEIIDPIYDWVLSYEDFKNYLLAKYEGVDAKDAAKSLGSLTNVNTVGTSLTYTQRFTPLKAGDQVVAANEQIRNVVSVTSATQVTIDLPFNIDLVNQTCAARNKIHSYYNLQGLKIDYVTWNALASNERSEKTFYEYEVETNEAKRTIKVIDKLYYNQIINEFERIFR